MIVKPENNDAVLAEVAKSGEEVTLIYGEGATITGQVQPKPANANIWKLTVADWDGLIRVYPFDAHRIKIARQKP